MYWEQMGLMDSTVIFSQPNTIIDPSVIGVHINVTHTKHASKLLL